MATSQEKRNVTLLQKCRKAVDDCPGVLAGDLPLHLRRFLRDLEKAGDLVCETRGNEFRWYTTEQGKRGVVLTAS